MLETNRHICNYCERKQRFSSILSGLLKTLTKNGKQHFSCILSDLLKTLTKNGNTM